MNKKTSIKSAIPILLLAFALAMLGPSWAAASGGPNDDEITHWVREALQEDPRVVSLDINVNTVDGIVTLDGVVSNLAEEKYAVLEAEKIKGVRGVISKLVVKPMQRSDADIRQDIRRRLLNSAAIQSHRLRVSVSKGEVTLAGEIASWTEKKQAELLASEVTGVKKVFNNLEVGSLSPRFDEAIRRDAVSTIARDVYLVGLPIHVSVKDGVLTLQGKVANAFQKERAGDDALVADAKQVKNDLTVEWWEWWKDDDKGARKAYPFPKDEELKKAVRDELYQDLRIEEPSEIAVDAYEGHITLRGSLPSYYQKRLAGEDARDVVGVAWVSNRLQVRTDYRDDKAILDDVRFEIRSGYALSRQNIDVQVRDGIVILSGSVNSSFEKDHAAEVASGVWGVKGVINNIAVDWWPRYGDAPLRARIKDRLLSNWETSDVADKIKVEVKDGKATLSGEVDTWAQYKEAALVTRLTEGIWAVDNKMRVAHYNYPWKEWQ